MLQWTLNVHFAPMQKFGSVLNTHHMSSIWCHTANGSSGRRPQSLSRDYGRCNFPHIIIHVSNINNSHNLTASSFPVSFNSFENLLTKKFLRFPFVNDHYFHSLANLSGAFGRSTFPCQNNIIFSPARRQLERDRIRGYFSDTSFPQLNVNYRSNKRVF